MNFAVSLLVVLLLAAPSSAAPVPNSQTEWTRLTGELAGMGLPSRFLQLLPSEFVKLEFAELKMAAAEYHPEEHRMIFNRALSLDNQGRRFRPLREIGNYDLATIYHELFHAYFDYIDFAAGTPRMPPEGARLHDAATRFVACRYTVVDVILGPQQKGHQRKPRIEQRRLSHSEGWDALNETWGVFVGWAIWNRLEVTNRLTLRWDWETVEEFWNRLEEAAQSGEITGYFEPADPDARKMVPRWYLASSNAISPPEIALLLEGILGESHEMAQLAVSWISSDGAKSC
jgi:hypothetical protein